MSHSLHLKWGRCAAQGIALAVLLLSGIHDCAAQNNRADTPEHGGQAIGAGVASLWLPEIARIMQRLEREVTFPPERRQSQLLPLLSGSTTIYAAFGNYAEVTRQVLKILREERETSPLLREWWQRSEGAKDRDNLELMAERFAQLEDYLGEEVVVSARFEEQKPGLFAAAEIGKPGLDVFLRKLIAEQGDTSQKTTGVLIFSPAQLAATKDKGTGSKLLILVHPKYLAASEDLSALRSFLARLDKSDRGFAGTGFAQRLAQEYTRGTSILAGADLQRMLTDLPERAAEKQSTLEESGFADAKYAIWGHSTVEGQTVSRGELSFTRPRHGLAAWLAEPQPLTTLDFVSPRAMMAATIVLMKPEKIFDDAKQLSLGSPSNPFVMLSQFEKMLRLSLRDDVLQNLQGELTLELDDFAPPRPMWRAIFKVKDAAHLQTAFDTLLAATQLGAERSLTRRVAITQFQIPSRDGPHQIAFAFSDGHLILGPNKDSVATAVELHNSGDSLGKSKSLKKALPPGHSIEASAVFYLDPAAMYALQMQRFLPGAPDKATKWAGQGTPSVICLYGEEMAIRSATRSSAMDAGVMLVVSAMAIPNLLRARMAANETSAVASLRTIDTAQITYGVAYPERGFATVLTKLGPNPADAQKPTEDHADLIAESLARDHCTFHLEGVCKTNPCTEYVVTATPSVRNNTGVRNFCCTSDAIIRIQPASGTLTRPPTVVECRRWEPVR